MTRSARLFLAALIGTTLGSLAPARAQDDPGPGAQTSDLAPDGAAARARDEFRAGEGAYEDERYAEALEHFQRAQQIDPHDVVRFNLAVCLQRLGRWSEAWAEYRALAASEELGESGRAYAAELLADLESRLATLRVETSEDAEVLVDGAPIGSSPIELRLEPGPHVIAARAGTREVSDRVTVERGDVVVRELVLPPELAPVATPRMRTVLRDPGWLSWTGTALAVLGAGGAIGLGSHAQALHARYSTPGQATLPLRDEGLLFRDLTNASFALLGAGVLLVAVDVALLLAGDGAHEVAP